MKELIFLLLLIPFFTKAQSDTSTFRALYPELNERPHKNVTWANTDQIILVINDSLYHTYNSPLLDQLIMSRKEGYSMDIIADPDSIQQFLRTRIKVLIVMKRQLKE